MGWLSAIGAGLGSLGGLFPQKQTTTTNQNSQFHSQQDAQFQSGGFTTPTFDQNTDVLRKNLINQVLGNLGQDTDLEGYKAGGLQQINESSQAAQQALQQSLAARGLSYSGGPASTQLEVGRFGQSSNFLNQIPLLRQQLMQQKIQQALDTFKAQPYGTSFGQSGTSSQQGSGTSSTQGTSVTKGGGGIGGLLGGLAGGFGSGAFGGGSNSPFQIDPNIATSPSNP